MLLTRVRLASDRANPIIISNPTISKAQAAAEKYKLPKFSGDAMVCLTPPTPPLSATLPTLSLCWLCWLCWLCTLLTLLTPLTLPIPPTLPSLVTPLTCC